MDRFRLTGRVVLITGATGHLGRAMCRGLAEAGADVAVCSTSLDQAQALADELARDFGVRARGFAADLRRPEHVPQLVKAAADHFGGLHGLVNNAYYGAANAFEKMTFEEWTTGLHGAVSSAMLTLQAALPFLEAGRGSVVNIASMYAVVSPDPAIYEGTSFANPVNYGAGKAALLQFTRYAAVHVAAKGVRVNAVSPGPFPSPQVQQHPTFGGRLAAKVPLGRVGEPAELQGAVVFLLSEAASYVTGHNLVVDGGWTLW